MESECDSSLMRLFADSEELKKLRTTRNLICKWSKNLKKRNRRTRMWIMWIIIIKSPADDEANFWFLLAKDINKYKQNKGQSWKLMY